MKAKYQSGTSFCIEIFDRTSRTCMTVAEAVRLKEELTKAIDDAEIDKKKELTEFEQEVSDIVEYCKEHGENVAFDYAKRHAKTLLALAKKELLKDGWHKFFSEEVKTSCTNKYPSLSVLEKLQGFKED